MNKGFRCFDIFFLKNIKWAPILDARRTFLYRIRHAFKRILEIEREIIPPELRFLDDINSLYVAWKSLFWQKNKD